MSYNKNNEQWMIGKMVTWGYLAANSHMVLGCRDRNLSLLQNIEVEPESFILSQDTQSGLKWLLIISNTASR